MATDTHGNSTAPPNAADEPSTPTDPQRQLRPKAKHDFPKSQASKMWDALGNPSSPANEMPGGMVNTAGGKPRDVSWRDAFDFSQFNQEGRPMWYQTGCARDSLLVGIGVGGGVGGLHFIMRGLSRMLATANFAVGAFVVTSTGMHYWCQRRQKQEARGIAAAMQGMKVLHEKRAKEKAVEEAAQEAAKRRADEERLQNQRWYKFW